MNYNTEVGIPRRIKIPYLLFLCVPFFYSTILFSFSSVFGLFLTFYFSLFTSFFHFPLRKKPPSITENGLFVLKISYFYIHHSQFFSMRRIIPNSRLRIDMLNFEFIFTYNLNANMKIIF